MLFIQIIQLWDWATNCFANFDHFKNVVIGYLKFHNTRLKQIGTKRQITLYVYIML